MRHKLSIILRRHIFFLPGEVLGRKIAVYFLGTGRIHRRNSGQLFQRSGLNPGNGAERFHQLFFAFCADAGNIVQRRYKRMFIAQGAMKRDGKAVRFIPNGLKNLQGGRGKRQKNGQGRQSLS